MLLIKNAHVKTMAGADLENGCVLIGDDGKIAAVGADIACPEGAQVIDAGGRLVTPGCVEAHSHIGLREAASLWTGIDHNEKTDPLTPTCGPLMPSIPRMSILPRRSRVALPPPAPAPAAVM